MAFEHEPVPLAPVIASLGDFVSTLPAASGHDLRVVPPFSISGCGTAVLIDPDGEVIATSEFVSIGLGDLRETTVRAADGQAVLHAFGTLDGTADEPLGAAAGSGVNQVSAPDATISPQR